MCILVLPILVLLGLAAICSIIVVKYNDCKNSTLRGLITLVLLCVVFIIGTYISFCRMLAYSSNIEVRTMEVVEITNEYTTLVDGNGQLYDVIDYLDYGEYSVKIDNKGTSDFTDDVIIEIH